MSAYVENRRYVEIRRKLRHSLYMSAYVEIRRHIICVYIYTIYVCICVYICTHPHSNSFHVPCIDSHVNIFPQKSPNSVSLWRKETCNISHPVHLTHAHLNFFYVPYIDSHVNVFDMLCMCAVSRHICIYIYIYIYIYKHHTHQHLNSFFVPYIRSHVALVTQMSISLVCLL